MTSRNASNRSAIQGFVSALSILLFNSISTASATDSDLIEALRSNDIEHFRAYLEKGGNPNVFLKVEESHKPLHVLVFSILGGRDQISRMLIEEGSDPRKTPSHLDPAILLATKNGLVNTVEILVKRPENAGYLEDCLTSSSILGSRPIVEVLLGQKDFTQSALLTAFVHAAGHGHEDIATLLLEEGVDPTTNGVLHAVVSASNVGLVQQVLNSGAPTDGLFDRRTVMQTFGNRLRKGRPNPTRILSVLVEYGLDACELEGDFPSYSKYIQAIVRNEAPECEWLTLPKNSDLTTDGIGYSNDR